jgi:SSS family solute:Na+ symporter
MANISGVLYEYLQSVQSYIAPPITAVFLLGIFHKRINGFGAFITLIVGIVVAAFRIILELVKDALDPDGILFMLGDMNFLTFSAWFFLFCVLLTIGASLMAPAPSYEKVVNLTFGTLTPEAKEQNKSSYNWIDIVVSVIVVGIVIAVMVSFAGG